MFEQLFQIAALASEKEVQGVQGTFGVKGNVLFFSRGQMIRVIQVPKFPKNDRGIFSACIVYFIVKLAAQCFALTTFSVA